MKSMIMKLFPKSLKSKIDTFIRRRYEYTKVSQPYQINIRDKGRFEGRIAVVTGGSGAIGRAICCRLAAEGATVYVCGMSEDRIKGVAGEAAVLGGMAFPVRLDVTSEQDIAGFFRDVVAEQGRIDILVNCAGGSAREKSNPIYELETAVIENILNVNLRGAMFCARAASKYMMEQRSGNIISVSSIIGERGKARFSEYSAAKGGIIAFTKSIAMELGKFGIKVNCVSPGIVQRGEVNEMMIEKLASTNYLNTYGRPEDISSMVAYLVSDEASFITGQNLIVDGGRSLGLKGD